MFCTLIMQAIIQQETTSVHRCKILTYVLLKNYKAVITRCVRYYLVAGWLSLLTWL